VDALDLPVLAKCTFLVNGVAETDHSRILVDGDTVDVLPPFAGG
jgi:molybdopterin converting factor small subunit